MELAEVDGEVDTALWAIEPGEAVGDVEYGLASGTGELDLGRIDALRWRSLAAGGSSGQHKLGRQHLR